MLEKRRACGTLQRSDRGAPGYPGRMFRALGAIVWASEAGPEEVRVAPPLVRRCGRRTESREWREYCRERERERERS